MSIWITLLGMGLVTLATRAIPLLTMRGELPVWLARWLSSVPVAVFTALALKPLAVSEGTTPQLMAGAPLIAGIIGGFVAWRTSNVLATIVAGMATYWAIRMVNGQW